MNSRGKNFDSPQKLSLILPDSLKKIAGKDKIFEYKLKILWAECVGYQISVHSEPDNIKRGILWVKVDSAVWINELSYRKDEILKTLISKNEELVINDIKFIQGKIIKKKKIFNKKPYIPSSNIIELPKIIEKSLDKIKDENLSHTIRMAITYIGISSR